MLLGKIDFELGVSAFQIDRLLDLVGDQFRLLERSDVFGSHKLDSGMDEDNKLFFRAVIDDSCGFDGFEVSGGNGNGEFSGFK